MKKFANSLTMKKRIGIILTAIALVIIGAMLFIVRGVQGEPDQPGNYKTKVFANMCASDGQVLAGANGIYGSLVPQSTSIFTIREDKIYYVEKITEAFEGSTDEKYSLYVENLHGGQKELLADDVFLPGAGNEMLIGDKIFYTYAYDEEHRLSHAYIDLNTGKTGKIKSDRISQILGYDGIYIYYRGYDYEREVNLLGRIRLGRNKDEVLAEYAAVDEVGYIESAIFNNGSFYCLSMKEKTDSDDYTTYKYEILQIDGQTGAVTNNLPMVLTGSSNYSFMIVEDQLYYSAGGSIYVIAADGNGEARQVVKMKEDEYWGILHLVPGDGYLYYEAIAQTDEETGNNDYFYRVLLEGGMPELLKAWFSL